MKEEELRRLRKLPLILVMFFKREEIGETGEKELSILLNKISQRNIVKDGQKYTKVTILPGLYEVIRLTIRKGRIKFGGGFQFR